MKCFYHNDLDGICSAAIVNLWWNSELRLLQDGTTVEPVEFIPMNYNKVFPINKILKNELVIIVDFSLQKSGEFEKLLEITNEVIWIDHHKTAIDKFSHIACKGTRKDGVAGCVLTWEYFFTNSPLPRIVEMIGHYDIWNFSKYGKDLNKLQAGIKTVDYSPTSPNWKKWTKTDLVVNELFQCEVLDDDVELLLNCGITALQYRTNLNRELVESWAFYTSFEGYRAIACNVGSAYSSQVFDIVDDNTYDIMLVFNFDGCMFSVSIYTKKDIDCSEIAKKYGGGGHKNAAGFQVQTLPFNRERVYNE